MIRFINLRGQETGYSFTFFDTVTDTFLRCNGNQAWDDWQDFAQDAIQDPISITQDKVDRCRAVCPPWVFSA